MSDRGILAQSLRLERVQVRRAVLAGVLVALSGIGLTGTSAWLIVRAAQEPAVLSLTVPMGLVQLFALSKAAGRYAERTQTHNVALAIMGHVRAAIARLLEPLVPAGLGPRSADVVDLVLRDVDRVQDLLTAVAGPLLTSAVAGVVTVVVAGLVVPWSAASLLVGLVTVAAVLPLVAQRLGRRSQDETDQARGELVRLFDDVAQSGDELVMNGATANLDARLADLEDRLDAAQRSHTVLMGVIALLASLASSVCVAATVGLSASALRDGHLAASLVAVPALISVAALELVSGVAPVMAGLRGDRLALARLEALTGLEAPVREPSEATAAVTGESSVLVEGARVAHDDDVVLDEVSVDLSPGDVVVLRGPSGGGKTTLARLITKFLDPQSGSLYLGDVNYAHLTSNEVRGHVGFVDDAPHVFATSVAGNLRIADPHASDAEIVEACERVGLGSFLDGLDDGIETPIGGVATGLSGGEQRRLGLARELLVRRGVVVLDEPTEGLDEPTASRVIDEVVDAHRDGVVLLISHLDDDLRRATRCVELRGGRLEESTLDH